PRFDSPSIFAAILARQRGGSFRISPVNPVPAGEQVYLRDTNLLTTTFHRAEGTLVLTDFMPCFNEGERFLSLKRICRGVEARGGPVEVECVMDPAPAYGRARTSFAEREGIVIASGGSQEVILSSTIPMTGAVQDVDGRPRFAYRFTLQPGKQEWFTLGFGERYFALGQKFPSSSDATAPTTTTSRCRSSIASMAIRVCRRNSWNTWPVSTAPVRCGSGTVPPASASWTCSAP